MEELVQAFHSTESYERKLQILTLSPYSDSKTIDLFQTSKYFVRKSKHLKKEYGIIPDIPHISKGKVICQDTKHLVRTFFESPEISRICPGVKDCFRIKNEEGIKETVKKQLVLMNLKEAFALYKADPNNPNIGFSSFASLRPRNCVLAGAAGTHSVCVCTYHQNVKLQFSSLGINYHAS